MYRVILGHILTSEMSGVITTGSLGGKKYYDVSKYHTFLNISKYHKNAVNFYLLIYQ